MGQLSKMHRARRHRDQLTEFVQGNRGLARVPPSRTRTAANDPSAPGSLQSANTALRTRPPGTHDAVAFSAAGCPAPGTGPTRRTCGPFFKQTRPSCATSCARSPSCPATARILAPAIERSRNSTPGLTRRARARQHRQRARTAKNGRAICLRPWATRHHSVLSNQDGVGPVRQSMLLFTCGTLSISRASLIPREEPHALALTSCSPTQLQPVLPRELPSDQDPQPTPDRRTIGFVLTCGSCSPICGSGFGGAHPARPPGLPGSKSLSAGQRARHRADVRSAGVNVGTVVGLRLDLRTAVRSRRSSSRNSTRRSRATPERRYGSRHCSANLRRAPAPATAPRVSCATAAESPTGTLRLTSRSIRSFQPLTQDPSGVPGPGASPGGAVTGRGEDINAFFGYLPGFVDSSQRLLTTLTGQRPPSGASSPTRRVLQRDQRTPRHSYPA